jgi:hypothetical protein
MTLLQLLDDLERMGFYKYSPDDKIDGLKRTALKTGNIYGYGDATKRYYAADSESLTECGVNRFLQRTEAFLVSQGVIIRAIENECDYPEKYSIVVDGVRFQLFSPAESASADLWDLVTKRSFAMINYLLERAGSPERLYQLYTGNDTSGVFLTEEMYQQILLSGLLTDQGIPQPIEPWQI